MENKRNRKWWDPLKLTLDKILMIFGILLFFFGYQIQVWTNTTTNYSLLGAFLFLAGLLLYAMRKK